MNAIVFSKHRYLVLTIVILFTTISCSQPYGNEEKVKYTLNEIPTVVGNTPKNVIIFIGDGMGPEHVKAGGYWSTGTTNSFTFESSSFQIAMPMGTRNVYGGITDSAASATAMATGMKVANGVLSMSIPGDGADLQTLAELARSAGKSIGIVTTDNVCAATPAAYMVHHDNRFDYGIIASEVLDFVPEVLFGGGKALNEGDAIAAGYSVVTDTTQLSLHDPDINPLYGRFGDNVMPYELNRNSNLPSLDHMVEAALDILDSDPDGFFLVVENALIDKSSHLNDIEKVVAEVKALDNAVGTTVQWADSAAIAMGSDETLIIVTADHETGGLTVLSGNGAGVSPTVSWSTTWHTSKQVDVFARGPDSSTFNLVLENVDIFRIISRYF